MGRRNLKPDPRLAMSLVIFTIVMANIVFFHYYTLQAGMDPIPIWAFILPFGAAIIYYKVAEPQILEEKSTEWASTAQVWEEFMHSKYFTHVLGLNNNDIESPKHSWSFSDSSGKIKEYVFPTIIKSELKYIIIDGRKHNEYVIRKIECIDQYMADEYGGIKGYMKNKTGGDILDQMSKKEQLQNMIGHKVNWDLKI